MSRTFIVGRRNVKGKFKQIMNVECVFNDLFRHRQRTVVDDNLPQKSKKILRKRNRTRRRSYATHDCVERLNFRDYTVENPKKTKAEDRGHEWSSYASSE